MTLVCTVMAGLDPAIPTFVTPAKAGVQLEASQRMKLDSGLRRNEFKFTKCIEPSGQALRLPG